MNFQKNKEVDWIKVLPYVWTPLVKNDSKYEIRCPCSSIVRILLYTLGLRGIEKCSVSKRYYLFNNKILTECWANHVNSCKLPSILFIVY